MSKPHVGHARFPRRFVIVGLLLTYGEFRSHQAYARRQYQCLTPDEVQRVGGAQRLLAFLDFILRSWSR